MPKRKYSKETEIGKQYGRLTVLDYFPAKTINNKRIRSTTLVKCICNSEPIIVNHSRLISETTKSCGCFHREVVVKLLTTHGYYNHPYYKICVGAIKRVKSNSHDKQYYYERGIKCFWTIKTIFDFISYLENNLPSRLKGQSLDRINNNGNYEPGNLRWASTKEQANNKRPPISNFQFDQLKKENESLIMLLTQNNIEIPESL